MGFYLRKSFRAGPVRLNLSKSGFGISGGIKGARIGAGPRGRYIHAGRHGLYYRQNLSSGKTQNPSNVEGEGCAMILLVVIALGVGIWLLSWLLKHPMIMTTAIIIALGIPIVRFVMHSRQQKLVSAYKTALDTAFVISQSPPNKFVLAAIEQQKQVLPSVIR